MSLLYIRLLSNDSYVSCYEREIISCMIVIYIYEYHIYEYHNRVYVHVFA